jgi:putative transposase
MFISYKTEINPTKEQRIKINKTIGNCRFIYNYYLAYNKELYEVNKDTNLLTFMSNTTFRKYMNHDEVFLNEHPWLKSVSSKSIDYALSYAYGAFKKFFDEKANFPKFKKKKQQKVKAHFARNNKTDFTVERHKIKIPTIGWIKIKEKGFIPLNVTVKSCSISQKADRYFISVLVEVDEDEKFTDLNEGVGIDVGIKDLAICSDGNVYKNINKSSKVRRIKKKLKRVQRRLSKKYLKKKERGVKSATYSANINKNILQLQKLYAKLTNIRTDYINKVILEIIKRKPSYITMEDLNIQGMMKNKHLARAIQEQKLFEFKKKIMWKCKLHGVEFREVSRWYASSKLCSDCGHKKEDLKLKDRTYRCSNCGLIIDRDLNAAINLKRAKDYIII